MSLAVGICYAIYLAGMAWIGRLYALGPDLLLRAWPSPCWSRPDTCGSFAAAIRAACFRAFLGNHWLGLAVFAGIALDYAIRLARWPRAW